jgi:sulfotransferase
MHFISGLPRSGSTLLASILRQNPRFTASIMTPVGRIVTTALTALGPDNEADSFITDEQRARVIRGIFSSFYAEQLGGAPERVVFDNNRRWCANASLLGLLYPGCKIICCVRAPAAIVDSFERLFKKNPLNLSIIYGSQANLTVYERTAEIMKPGGVVGFALNSFKDAFFSENRSRLLVVNYDDLCRFPERTMGELHSSLRLEPFMYDFNRIEPIPGAAEFDRDISTPGLHDLKPKVTYETRVSVLPPDIFNNLPSPFWLVKKEATSVG